MSRFQFNLERPVASLASLAATATFAACLAVGGAQAAVLSTSFTVSGDVTKTMSFDYSALQNLPLTKITYVSGASTYVGVSFYDLLTTVVGVNVNASIKNDILGKYVVATGTDGYQSVFSLGELNPGFGNQPDLIAYQLNGAPLTADGVARVVVPNDVKAGRWVSNLVSLQVFSVPVASAVPEPETVALMLVGLVAVGGLVKRRAWH